MKILYISSFYDPYIGGGAEIGLQENVEGMKRLGHDVSVLSLGPYKGLHIDNVNGIKVYRSGYRNIYFHFGKIQSSQWKRVIWHTLDIYNPFNIDSIQKVIALEKPDVISCHNLAGWSISVWDVCYNCGIPIVQVLHDQYLLCPKSNMFNNVQSCKTRCFLCRIMRQPHSSKSNKVTAVVGVSKFVLDQIISFDYFKNVPIRTFIHNSRTFPFHINELQHRLIDEYIVFGFIGTLAKNKGIEMLLETFIKVAKPNWKLRIAGSGKTIYENTLKERFNDPRIVFLGYCSQKDFFTSIDISVVPSLNQETLGMVVIESLMFGVPVIGSNHGGIPEMLCDGENGFIFEPYKPHELGQIMLKMAETLHEWSNKRLLIQKSALPFMDINAWNKNYEHIYIQSINK